MEKKSKTVRDCTLSHDFEKFAKEGYHDFEVEALQEIANVGIGHAATALSQLLHRRVDMSIPILEIVKAEDLGERIAGSLEDIVAAILVDTKYEDQMFNLLLFFDEASIKNILRILKSGEPPETLADLDEISSSIIKETGNILLLHTITAINSFTESTYWPSPPQISIDMAGSIIEEILGRENKDSFLLIECDVFTSQEIDGSDKERLKGIILILPNREGLRETMSRLYGAEIYDELGG